MSRGRSSAIDAAIALLIRVMGAGLVFGLQVLLARLLPGEGYGGYVTVWTWMLALGSFAAMGFAESSVRFLPRYAQRQRLQALLGYWQFGLAVVLIVGAAIAAIALGVWLGGGLDGALLTIVLVAIGLPILGLEYYLEGIARSMGWFRLAAVPVYILRPMLIGGSCLALAAAGVTLTLPMVGGVLIGCMGTIALLMLWLVARRIKRLAGGTQGASYKQRRLWLRASLPLLLLSGLEDLTSYADILVLSLLSGPDIVGLYFAAARTLALAGFVAYAMTLVSGHRFALDLASANRSDLQTSILEATRLTFWATLVAVGLALVAAPWLLGAFGSDYLAGQPLMIVLGLGMVARAMSGQSAEALVVLGRQREGLIIALGVVAVTAVGALALVPELGALGAAIASATAMACRTLALAVLLWQREGLKVVSMRTPVFLGRRAS